MRRRVLLGFGVMALAALSFLGGRNCPLHHYVQLGHSSYLYDDVTGHLCNPAVTVVGVTGPTQPTALDILRAQAAGQTQPSTVPACGKE